MAIQLYRSANEPRGLDSFFQDFDRTFGDMLQLFQPLRNRRDFGSDGSMSIDVEEEDNRYVVVADLAGFSPEEVNVEIRNQELVISASHEENKGDEKQGRTRRRSDVYQSFTLPQDVNSDDIKADFKHGELCVYLPRSESSKPRKIQIAGSSSRTSKPSLSTSSTAPDDGQNFNQSQREKSAS